MKRLGVSIIPPGPRPRRRRLTTLGLELANPVKRGTVGVMKMLGKPALKKKAVTRVARPRTRNAWVGYAEGKLTIAPGFDLTKPTLPIGNYL